MPVNELTLDHLNDKIDTVDRKVDGLRAEMLDSFKQAERATSNAFAEHRAFTDFAVGQAEARLGQQIGAIDRRLGAFEQKTDGRFNAIERKFDRVDERLAGLEGLLGGLEGRFDGLEGRFGGLEVRFGGLEGRSDSLSQQFAELKALVIRALPKRRKRR